MGKLSSMTIIPLGGSKPSKKAEPEIDIEAMPAGEPEEDSLRASWPEVASALGIPEDKSDEAFDVLKGFIEQIVLHSEESEAKDEESELKSEE